MPENKDYSKKAVRNMVLFTIFMCVVLTGVLAAGDAFDAVYMALFLGIAALCTWLFDPLAREFPPEAPISGPVQLTLRGNVYWLIFFFAFLIGWDLVKPRFGFDVGSRAFRDWWLIAAAFALPCIPYIGKYFWSYFRHKKPQDQNAST